MDPAATLLANPVNPMLCTTKIVLITQSSQLYNIPLDGKTNFGSVQHRISSWMDPAATLLANPVNPMLCTTKIGLITQSSQLYNIPLYGKTVAIVYCWWDKSHLVSCCDMRKNPWSHDLLEISCRMVSFKEILLNNDWVITFEKIFIFLKIYWLKWFKVKIYSFKIKYIIF